MTTETNENATATPAKASKAAKAPKAPKPTVAPKADKPLGRRAQIEADAASGIIPAAPNFEAETHKRFRKRLGEIVDLIEKGDSKALESMKINPISSTPLGRSTSSGTWR